MHGAMSSDGGARNGADEPTSFGLQLQEDGRGALEVGFVVAVKSDTPGGAGSIRADEAVAGPLVFAQDAAQHLGVGVVGVPALAELDGVELIAQSAGPVRGRRLGAGDQLASKVGSLWRGGRHALPRSSRAASGS